MAVALAVAAARSSKLPAGAGGEEKITSPAPDRIVGNAKDGLMEARRTFRLALSKQDGASAIEYAFLASLIALAIVVAIGAVGFSLSGFFQSVADAL